MKQKRQENICLILWGILGLLQCAVAIATLAGVGVCLIQRISVWYIVLRAVLGFGAIAGLWWLDAAMRRWVL